MAVPSLQRGPSLFLQFCYLYGSKLQEMKRILTFCISLLIAAEAFCGDGFLKGYRQSAKAPARGTESTFEWSGYTNWWNSIYFKQMRYGNLYKITVPDAGKMFAQARRDIAVDLGLTGLQMEEGFIKSLASAPYTTLVDPDVQTLKEALKAGGNVLVLASRDSELGGKLASKGSVAMPSAPSYQTRGGLKNPLDAFVLSKGSSKLFVAVGRTEDLARFRSLAEQTVALIKNYDLKRGWFAVGTDYRTVTCQPGTPLEVIAAGMDEGNSWFVFSGEYERLNKANVDRWIDDMGHIVEAAVGTHTLYDCESWDGFQEQLMNDDMHLYAKERDARHGYLFRPVADKGDYAGTGYEIFDGLLAQPGYEPLIDTCSKPFAVETGKMAGGTENCMILFVPKGEPFSRKAMWSAILDRRAVGMEKGGVLIGPESFRRPVQMLMLDSEWIEDCFGDRVSIKAYVEGTTLKVDLANMDESAKKGTFSLGFPAGVAAEGGVPQQVSVPASGVRHIEIELALQESAMGRRSPIVVGYDWGKSSKKVIAELDMPEAVATHRLLYGTTSGCEFPVSVFNITGEKKAIEVKVSVAGKETPAEPVAVLSQSITLGKAQSGKLVFDLKLPAGSYTATAEAMGICATTQLGIGGESGGVSVRREDTDGDGIDEYIMENASVRVTLLAIGARVIEYYVKSKDDNVLFKNWPNQPDDLDRPYRRRNFWPYGGFEDFLGQASVETHEVFDAEIVKDGGDCGEVVMRADFYGNIVEKRFTLYGDTPLLGVRFALDMVNPEFNVLGPQPILEVGKAHDEQDRVIVPEAGGLGEYTMRRDNYWGKFLYPVEGWNVDYDTVENLYFAGAFPVDQPFTLHMWHNHPRNRDTRFYYCEMQTWMDIYRHNTTYFSYYMWAAGGPWQEGIEALRERNLITETKK